MPTISRRKMITASLAGLAALPLLAAGARPARAATHRVEISGFAFAPAALQVGVGDTVVFTNMDGAPHTATAEDGSFDTGTIRRGKSAEITVGAAGAHAYRCKFHPNMKGTITAG